MKQSSEKFMDMMLEENTAFEAKPDFAKILDERIDAAMKKYTENLEKLINPAEKLEVIKEKENEENEQEGSREGTDERTDDSGDDSEC